MSSNNLNSNNFLLGVTKNNKNNNNPSDSLINHLKKLEKEELINNNRILNNKKNYPSIGIVVNELIEKLENDVYVLNNKIKSFNIEKKTIMDLDKKEINNLKSIIKKLYILILTINKTIKNKNLSVNNKKSLIEKVRKNIQSSKGFLKIVDEIMQENNDEISDLKEENLSTTFSNNDKKMSDIIVNRFKNKEYNLEDNIRSNITEVNTHSNNGIFEKQANNTIFEKNNTNKNTIFENKEQINEEKNNNSYQKKLNEKTNENNNYLKQNKLNEEISNQEISNNLNYMNEVKNSNLNKSNILNIIKNNDKKNKKYNILKKKISNTKMTQNEAKESLEKYFL